MTDRNEKLEALRLLLHTEFEGFTLACWQPPFFIAGRGWVVELAFYDTSTYQGPRAFLVLDPNEELDVDAASERVQRAIDDITLDPGETLKASLADVFSLPELPVTMSDYTPSDEAIRRREAALAEAFSTFEIVAQKFRDVFGMRLPRHVAVWRAMTRSFDPLESRGADYVGRYPAGYMDWFDDPTVEPRDGIDPRVHFRYRCDPPEFVTIASGDSDGLHYGLWYDDPNELPAFVASNYARDSAETWRAEPTMLGTLWAEHVDRVQDQLLYGEEVFPASVAAFASALSWFLDADALARGEVAELPLFGIERPEIIGSLGPALSPADGDPRGTWEQTRERDAAIRNSDSSALDGWITTARTELAAGKPAFALTLGRELHWFDSETTREVARELLTGAYRSLGRDALAEIVDAHYTHRDLQSVGIY